MNDFYLKSNNLKSLIKSTEKKPLALFVGAGINVPRISVWNQLLNTIMEKIISMKYSLENLNKETVNNLVNWHTTESVLSVYEKASLIKILLGKQYLYFLKDVLYDNCDEKPSATFNNIVDLCSSQKVQAIVTYNYDDYLFTAIQEKEKSKDKLKDKQILRHPYDATDIPAYPDKLYYSSALPFYFVHGSIPRMMSSLSPEKTNIVLSYDEYFNNMLDPYSWQTTTQIYFLRNFTCLFLGVSLSDWNMLRLIQYANNGNNSIYIIMAGKAIEESIIKKNTCIHSLDCAYHNQYEKNHPLKDNEKANIIKTKATILDSFGVKLIYSGYYFEQVAKAVNYINEKL